MSLECLNRQGRVCDRSRSTPVTSMPWWQKFHWLLCGGRESKRRRCKRPRNHSDCGHDWDRQRRLPRGRGAAARSVAELRARFKARRRARRLAKLQVEHQVIGPMRTRRTRLHPRLASKRVLRFSAAYSKAKTSKRRQLRRVGGAVRINTVTMNTPLSKSAVVPQCFDRPHLAQLRSAATHTAMSIAILACGL